MSRISTHQHATVNTVSKEAPARTERVFPNRIAFHRRVARVTQRSLASVVRLSSREIRRIESGTVMPSAGTLIRISHSLRVDPCALVDLEPG